ncbi:unnamed protein product [Closterium sp. Naga37s-1]|nr:unnamed protein product [Closterium sp. Naga37s-1]
MFNARCESLHAKPSFRRLLPSQRCIVLLEGFYEWKKEGSKKQPFYIHMNDGRPMVMAGLFDCWTNAQGERLFTFTIVTTASSQRLQWLHDRMPAILPSQHHVAAWLHGKLSGPDAITHLCSPYNHPDLLWHAVTPEVGKPAFNGPQCVQPISLKPALSSTPITQLFARKRQKTPPTDAVGTGGVDKQEAEAGEGALEEGHRVKGEEGGSGEEKQLAGVQEAPVEAGAGADEGDGASEEQAKGGSSANETQEGAGEQRSERGVVEELLPVTPLPQDMRAHASQSSTQSEQHPPAPASAPPVAATVILPRASPVVEATTASEGGSSERRTDAGLAGERPAQSARGDGSARRPAAESRETGAQERKNELSDDDRAEAKEEAGLEMEEEEEEEDSFLAHWSWAGWVRDVVELRFLEDETAVRRPMPPLPPQYPASARASAREILVGDAGYVRALGEVARWWAESWRVPLQYEYDPADVAHYFNRRPHIVLLRTLKISVLLAATWVQVARDTGAIRAREAGGVSAGDERIAAIRQHSALKLKRTLLRLGPTFIKVAQSLSARPDVVGPDTAKVLAELQDRLPAFPSEDAMLVIERELGRPAAALFPLLSPTPVAAASFGQVYKGRTRDGMRVAVKVQRPRVLFLVARDIHILRMLLRAVRRVAGINTDLAALADEFGRGLYGELDYRHEATNATLFAKAHAHLPGITVPAIRSDLTSRRVLTMEWVEGEHTSDLLAQAQGVLGAAGGEEARQRAKQKLLRMVGIGVESSLEQLLVTGVLHADPHPGNLLLTPQGQVAYLDFGLLCRMERQHQQAMLAAVAHLVNGEWSMLAADLAAMDVLKPTTDRRALTMALEEAFGRGRQRGAASGGAPTMQFGQVTSELWRMALRFRFRLPPYYTLVLRSLASLEGIGVAVDPSFRVFASAYPYVVRRLLTDSSPSSRHVLRQLVQTREGKLRWERFASFAASSTQAQRDLVASLAMPSLQSPIPGMPPMPGASPLSSSAATAGAASPRATPSPAALVMDVLLSRHAASARRVILESDMRALAEAFVSPEAEVARDKLARVVADALCASLGVAQLPLDAITASQLSSSPTRLLAPSPPPPPPAAALGFANQRQPPGSVGVAGVSRSESGYESGSGSGSESEWEEREGRATAAEAVARRKRLWLLLGAAFGRMGGSVVLKVRVVLAALAVLLAALGMALKRVLVDAATRFKRLTSHWLPSQDDPTADQPAYAT